MLLFTDTVDDFWVNVNGNYKEAEIKSVTRSDIDLNNATDVKEDKDSDKPVEKGYEALVKYFKESLGTLVKEVKISKKLASTPACLAVADGSMDIRMERYLIEQKQLVGASAKILEINPTHHIIKKISLEIDDKNKHEQNKDLIHLLYDQACIIEGEPVYDVSAFSKRLNSLFEKLAL